MMDSIPWKGRWPHWRQVSILVKVGTIFIALALTFGIFLLTTSNLTKQLIGTSKAIEQAGTERMRIYKLASLIQQLTPSSENERELIRNEIAQFERVMEGLRNGTPRHGSVATLSPMLSVQLQALQDRWVMQLRPTLELALKGGATASAAKEYLVNLDDFVAGWDLFVQSMEQQSARRLQSLYEWQTWFLVLFFGLMGAALIFFDRVVREPLKQLTAGADRLAAGELHAEIQIRSDDELGQLARTHRTENRRAERAACDGSGDRLTGVGRTR
jgi:two-component system, NarL family, nitrate/nitrite sensor histidine kinase NarX